MAHLDCAFQEELLDIPVAKGEPVIQPDRVPNHAHWETVAVGLQGSHSQPAYPNSFNLPEPA